MVTVIMITYGHENFIKQAIDGVLQQHTNFPVELIIANDCSPDGSDAIIKNAIVVAPENITIKYTRHDKNLGMMPNFMWALAKAQGKYIALCEGDDYWTDPLKLQKQVDFLEANGDYAMCFHPVIILKPDGDLVEDFITKVPENFEERITLASNPNYIHTPSVVFRNIIKEEFQRIEFQNSPIGDYILYLMITKYGKIGYLKDTMAVYRYGVGVYSSTSDVKKQKAEILLFINLFSIEKDTEIKKIFYNNICNYLANYDNKIINLGNQNKLLNTRRHKVIEKLYRKLKKY